MHRTRMLINNLPHIGNQSYFRFVPLQPSSPLRATHPIRDEIAILLDEPRKERVRVPGECRLGREEAGAANVQLNPLVLFALDRILRRGGTGHGAGSGRCSTATVAVLPVQVDRGHLLGYALTFQLFKLAPGISEIGEGAAADSALFDWFRELCFRSV